MKLVIGGAWQGKREYACRRYGIPESLWTDGERCSKEEFLQAEAICSLHAYIRRRMEDGVSAEELGEEILAKAEHGLQAVTTDEVGYGVVPMDGGERAWREACGRICTRLAACSQEVVRVCCGIGTVIKG